jgi:hypothetical protein
MIEGMKPRGGDMVYTPDEIAQILKTLEIEPYRADKVDSRQAAQILKWRSKQECGEEHPYTPTSIRARIVSGDLHPIRINERLNIYDVNEVFNLVIRPNRAAGAGGRAKKKDQAREASS